MKFWTTPKGEELTFTEFLTRWRSGIKQAMLTISPQKQNQDQIKFTWIMFIGLCCGIVVSIVNFEKFWWVGIVLLAGLGNTMIQLVGLYQKKKAFENFILFEEAIGGEQNEQKSTDRI